MDLQKFKEKIKQYNPNADLDLITKAYHYASKAHSGQKRKSGEDYIVHPLEVANILVDLHLDVVTIAAAILHDVVEDTEVTLEDLKEEFNEEVALLVDGVTKLSRIEYTSKEEQQVQNLRKMFFAMAKDIRVILIKLADRLHNMRTLKYHSSQKQKEIAEETVEIFAPLAHRLGIFKIKWELEDLALRYLEPEVYYDLVKSISMKRQEREEYINEVIEILQKKMDEMNIKADISGRPKHFYSIYNKMVKKDYDLNQIYDLIAVRVIVDTVKDCYAVLGIIHTLWKPIPGRFKDYIAMPKPNMYQSLHTTVIGPRGEPFEIQIRTWEMHKTAEYGIAAHWLYKQGKTVNTEKEIDERLTWLRQLTEWQREQRDPREFMESLKIDFFSDRVYVFTPKGEVIELPAGSIPIDFAYRIHSQVGHQCVGAKVNGKIVPIDYKLKTGDIVEILTSKGSGPSRDWLHMVQTSQARNRIRQWFRKEKRDENIRKGREILEKECEKEGVNPNEVLKNSRLAEAGKKYNIMSSDDLLSTIGDGGINPLHVISFIIEKYGLERKERTENKKLSIKPWSGYGKPSKGIRVKGIDNVMVRVARCCNPLPGDEIIGYITRGRGVSIHRTDCPNIINTKGEEPRLIEAAWDTTTDSHYQVQLEIIAVNRPKLTLDIMNAITETKTDVNAIHARTNKNNLAIIDLKLEIRSLEHLNYIKDKIKRIKDIIEVKRITPSNI